ncbi:glutaredoxin-C9-like [Primulina eburnea]|uniref:glutaredoxin-C9-like n=1 Tax=Primulina eburnea TaxID=1245227 RepID=UPI003C6C2F9F
MIVTCHVVKQLLFGLGVAPAIFEIPAVSDSAVIISLSCRGGARNIALSGLDSTPAFLVVFVGGKFLGGIEAILAQHVSGALVPPLKDAGALWL